MLKIKQITNSYNYKIKLIIIDNKFIPSDKKFFSLT